MDKFIQLVISGTSLGAIYGLVAIGFVLVYKATDVMNFAHGELMALGAYFAITMLTTFDLPIAAAMVVTLLFAAAIGAGVHYVCIRPMAGEPIFSVVMVTIGLSVVFRALILMIWGPGERVFSNPLPNHIYEVAGYRISSLDLIILGVVALSVSLFAIFFRKTSLGLHMRATANRYEAALMMGVNPDRVFAVAWGVAALMAGLGGIFLANILGAVSIGVSAIGLRAFPAAVVGGLDSVSGAVVGGLLIGVTETLATGYIGAEARDVAAFALLLVVLVIRPFGLFGQKEIVRV
jgi:branched-chain amino acid transport system permease protein